jgi:hypothetical protein
MARMAAEPNASRKMSESKTVEGIANLPDQEGAASGSG